MVLVTKGMWFSGTEHPAWACPFVQPDGHALVKTARPTTAEDQVYILLPERDRLPHFPHLVFVYWWAFICKSKSS